MDGVGLAGDGAPGLLALGLVHDPEILLSRAIRIVVDSLEREFPQAGAAARAASREEFGSPDSGGGDAVSASREERRGKRRYRPRPFFRSPMLDPKKGTSVAVIPFLNLSERRNAGTILAFHFVDQLLRNELLTVIEPGLVREELLKYRLVMTAGPSFANAQILSSPQSLKADLVLSGEVFEYQDSVGVPVVDFSVKVIERTSRRLVWSSRSHNTGDQAVFFFDAGMVDTAHRLASEMARGTSQMFAR
jgi:TolB-like protein